LRLRGQKERRRGKKKEGKEEKGKKGKGQEIGKEARCKSSSFSLLNC
jgi:hypothetical protein